MAYKKLNYTGKDNKMLFWVFKVLMVFIFISDIVTHGHYSNEINPNEEEHPFRMLKSNQLWDKAKLRFGESANRMSNLYADLKVHDKQLGSLKKLKAQGLNRDGLMEADMERKFLELMKKHGLITPISQYADELDNETSEKRTTFTDKKLHRLWNKALLAGFSEGDLELLKEEFIHQQTKLDEYYQLKTEVDDAQKNTLEMNKDGDFDAQSIKVQEKKLKQAHRELKSRYTRLEGLAIKAKDADSEFKDNRVHELWALAQSVNMTDDELSSLKEELKHFENRIEKHDYFENLLEKSEKSEDAGSAKREHLEKKTSEYKHTVKKIHKDLKRKINEALERHTEL